MKKILTVLGIFVVLGFVFTGVPVASAADSCIVGPLNVSATAEYASYGDGGVLNVRHSLSDRLSAAPTFNRYGDNEIIRPQGNKAIRVSTPPKMVGTAEQSKPVLPRTTC